MVEDVIKKQVSVFLPLSHWKRLRLEAARLRIPMTQLVVNWIQPQLNQLEAKDVDKSK